MADPFASWTRLVAIASDLASISLRGIETLVASGAVVTMRSRIVGEAMRAPSDADYAELGRMIPEKVEAFSKAGSTLIVQWWALQVGILSECQHMAMTAMGMRAPATMDWPMLSGRYHALLLRSLDRGVSIGAMAIRPIHEKATANARRLKRTQSIR